MSTYFIVGASRGIGLSIVKVLANSGHKVIAGVRNPTPALSELQAAHPKNLSTEIIDVEDDNSVKTAATRIAHAHPEGIDYLILNAAKLGTKDLTASQLLAVMNTNVAGPLRVITEFLPLVRKSQRKVFVTISSFGGSNASQEALLQYYHACGTTDPVFYSYRTSKAALNFLTLAFALDHKSENIIFVPVNPGLVETDMMDATNAKRGDHFGVKTISADESAQKLIELSQRLTLADSGKFLSLDGTLMPL